MTTNYQYPKNFNKKSWEKYLGRSLTDDEDSLLKSIKLENYVNVKLKGLHKQCKDKNLHIPYHLPNFS